MISAKRSTMLENDWSAAEVSTIATRHPPAMRLLIHDTCSLGMLPLSLELVVALAMTSPSVSGLMTTGASLVSNTTPSPLTSTTAASMFACLSPSSCICVPIVGTELMSPSMLRRSDSRINCCCVV